MRIVFISNFINHHQVPLSDELYSLLNGDFCFIETAPMPQTVKKIGYPDFSLRPYLIPVWKSDEYKSISYEICDSADIIIFSTAYSHAYVPRYYKSNKIMFEVGERWLKRGLLNVLSPRFLRWLYEYYRYYHNNRYYRLCSSAYASSDVNMFGAYKERCYKWGYFTKVNNAECLSVPYGKSISDRFITIMWCARFLDWKHPELAVRLAFRLKQKGYRFILNMYGGGEELERTRTLVKDLDVESVVNFCGNKPNDEILYQMRRHDVFLFTSDKNEGWGAVLNEAMSSGCAIVASDEIGAVPFLIQDGVNGCIFKSCDLDSLEEKIEYIIKQPEKRIEMSKNAYRTIEDIWSPRNAAKQLLNLINAIQLNDSSLVPISGPCSIAENILKK